MDLKMSFLNSNTPIYIFTWNPKKDFPDNHEDIIVQASKGKTVKCDWKVRAHKRINIGDRCILVRVGRLPASERGLVGWGTVCGEPYEAVNYYSTSVKAYFVPIKFEYFSDLPIVSIDVIYRRFPFNKKASPWAPQSSGVPFNEEQVPNLLTLISERESKTEVADSYESENFDSHIPTKVRNGQGYIRDAEKKHAIEMRGMVKAREWLQQHNFKQIEDRSSNNSYDYSAYKNGKEYFVEVKGLTGEPTSINMGRREVELHKKSKGKSILLVVHGIKVTTSPKIKASGGRVKAYDPWDINKCKLSPTEYKVTL
jgi:hypothetical protein